MAKKRKSKSDERAKLYTTAPPGDLKPDESAAERITRKAVDAVWGVVTTTGTAAWDAVHSALQSKNASQPRPNALQDVVYAFVVRTEGKGTEKELPIYLDQYGHPIETVTQDAIEWTDYTGRVEETPITALRGRLSRAKEDFRSR